MQLLTQSLEKEHGQFPDRQLGGRNRQMNIKEVAKLAGVSVASVSRAFQNPPSPSVSPKQRERILRI